MLTFRLYNFSLDVCEQLFGTELAKHTIVMLLYCSMHCFRLHTLADIR